MFTASPSAAIAALSIILGVSFIDAGHGWLLGYGGCGQCLSVVRTTSDGGQTWQGLPNVNAGQPDASGVPVAAITFATGIDGWIYGSKLFATHDGGMSWSDETPRDSRIVDLQAHGRVAWRLDRARTCAGDATCTWSLQLSGDAGRSWLPSASLPPVANASGTARMEVRGSNEVWINASFEAPPAGLPRAQLLVTRDAGASWQQRTDPCDSADPGAGFASSFAKSLDGQQLWLICGGEPAAGQQLKSQFVSNDDGQHWSQPGQLIGSGYVGPLVALTAQRAFWGRDRGAGTALGTRDGGRTWQHEVQEPDGGDSLTAPISFVDSLHGWILAPHAVWRTSDGGESWQRFVP